MITVLGDVHGKERQCLEVIADNDYVFQLGDLGFNYSYLEDVDTFEKFKFIGGNHDNWDTLLCKKCVPGYLGRYGVYTMNGIRFFYISGGYSIDSGPRREHKIRGYGTTWWHQEELNFVEMEHCKKLYMEEKPEVLITHSPCRYTINKMTNTDFIERMGFSADFYCQTSSFYDHLLKCHAPKTHIAGHMHSSYQSIDKGILFYGLAELETLDLTQEFIDSL